MWYTETKTKDPARPFREEKRGVRPVFCKACGALLGEDERFCPNCGASVDPTPAPAEPEPSNPLLSVRSGPLFLAAVICLSVLLLFEIVSAFTTVGALGRYLDELGLGEAAMFTGMRVGAVLGALGDLAIAGVILAGLWMVYASGAGDGKPGELTRGLKLIRGGVLVDMVVMIVGMAMLAVFLLSMLIGGMTTVFLGAGLTGGSLAGMDEEFLTVAGLAVAALGLLVLTVGGAIAKTIFYLKVRAALDGALTTARTGEVTGAPAVYVPVMCFILAGWTGLLVLIGVTTGLLPILDAFVASAAYILFGLVALQYRDLAKDWRRRSDDLS